MWLSLDEPRAPVTYTGSAFVSGWGGQVVGAVDVVDVDDVDAGGQEGGCGKGGSLQLDQH